MHFAGDILRQNSAYPPCHAENQGMMMLKKYRFVSCLFALWLAMPASAFADANSDFTRLMTQGIEQYKAGKNDPSQYETAIATFKKAYALNPNPDITYNIARAYHQLGNCESALSAYREYALTSPTNADSVSEYISELSSQCDKKMGALNFICSPTHAVISIDNSDIKNAPCSGKHALPFGTYRIHIAATDYTPQDREVTIDSTHDKTMMIELEPHVADEQTPQTVSLSEFTPFFWGGVGAAGGGVLLTIIGGALLGTAHSSIEYNNIRGLYERNDGKQDAGAALLSIGVVATLAGVGLFVADTILRTKSSETTSANRFIPSLSVAADGASAGLNLSF